MSDTLILDKKSKPKFIIAYGPPGCGKSSITNVLYPGYTRVNVDDIISEMKEFVSQAQVITSMIDQGMERSEIEQHAALIYQSFRDEADKRSEELLDLSLRDKKNIVFETTGGSVRAISYLEKIIPDIKSKEYKIQIIFPHAPINIIRDRVYLRGQATGRLPSEKFLESSYQYSCLHFGKIADMCDKVLVYDSSSMLSTSFLILYHRHKKGLSRVGKGVITNLPDSLMQYLFK